MLFSEFSLENVTLTRGTPPFAPHMEVPPGVYGMVVLICLLGVGEIIWGLKLLPPPPPPRVTFLFEDQ